MAKKKNAAAVELGRRGAKARLTKLTAEQRSEVAKKAATARWKDKTPAKETKPRNAPLTLAQRAKQLAEKAASDPRWKNKTTGAKKI